MNTQRQVRRFNIRAYSSRLAEEAPAADAAASATFAVREERPAASAAPFEKTCEAFRKEMEREFNGKINTKEGDDQVRLERMSVLGDANSVTTLLEKIETFLAEKKLQHSVVPPAYEDVHLFAPAEQRKYSNLAHALLHEEYGLGQLAVWLKYPDSYALQVIFPHIWIHDPQQGRHVRMPYKLSRETFDKIVRALENHKANANVTEQKPTLELDMYTGERVSILIEPRVRRAVITFRRVLTKNLGLQGLCEEKRSFPPEQLPLFRGFSRAMANIVYSGPMGTGKTQFLRAMVHERADHLTGVAIEQDYESHISTDNPHKKMIEMVLGDSSFEEALEKALRTDADYGFIQEIRMKEAEGALVLMERLQKGFMTTTHIWRPETLPEQWARLICRVNGGGDPAAEMKRVAEYVDLIVLLEQNEAKTRKRVRSVQELRYNRENGEISTHQIVRFNAEADRYEYRFDLSRQLLDEMRSANAEWTGIVCATLRGLEAKSPIPAGEGITVFNPAVADPQYRLALFTEQLAREQRRTADAMERLLQAMLDGKSDRAGQGRAEQAGKEGMGVRI